ncbi:MAG: MgtC/SapB family protein [Ferruginibacter sp.]|nr:MgtC/SapB family protein [Bacteroidota bacterium]MBX2919550.1 MgtC/SapB family protein [Ferruginibacter sp.]MCC7378853.1 MgtC/SapB family protein [Chitinophagaceae bacterium]
MLAWKEILIRLLLASLFGALIGLERERKNWSAGMRTHMMVCVGSSLIMIVSAFGFADVLGKDHIVLDPARVAAQVISGIGFIGAGAILFLKQGTIRGLTTASGLWTVAAIGLATGGGMYFAAGATTIIALIILWALQPFERMYSQKFKQKTLRIVTTSNENYVNIIKALWQQNGIGIQSFQMNKDDKEFILQFVFDTEDENKLSQIINELQKDSNIKEIFWTH